MDNARSPYTERLSEAVRPTLTRHKFVILDSIGRIDRVVERVCRDLADAVSFAQSLPDANTIEIWQGRTMLSQVRLATRVDGYR